MASAAPVHSCEINGNTFNWTVRCSCGWVCANLATEGEVKRERDAHLASAAAKCSRCGLTNCSCVGGYGGPLRPTLPPAASASEPPNERSEP